MKDDLSQKEACIISYLSRGDQYASQRVQSYERFLVNMFPASRLKVEQGKRGANKLGKMMKEHQTIAQGSHGDMLQVIKLHGDFPGETTSTRRFCSRPGDSVSGSTSHAVGLFTLRTKKRV